MKKTLRAIAWKQHYAQKQLFNSLKKAFQKKSVCYTGIRKGILTNLGVIQIQWIQHHRKRPAFRNPKHQFDNRQYLEEALAGNITLTEVPGEKDKLEVFSSSEGTQRA